jgi:hypothetical protein
MPQSKQVQRFIQATIRGDFTNLKKDKTNLDFRRKFHKYIAQTPINATTIFNGPFMDLLTDMPLILFKQKRFCVGVMPIKF